MSQELTRTNGGSVAPSVTITEGFGTREIERSAETATSAVAARAQAEVQARFIVADRRPRDVERFRVRLLRECKRPGFAELAEYERPVGRQKNENTGQWEQKIARGPTIRLIETAVQNYGNVVAEAPVVFEGDEFRIVRAQMCDLETNTTWTQDVVVPKRVEKRGDNKGRPPLGREVVSQRINSGGDTTYLVTATDDEVAVKQLALISKAQRKNAERLLPSDIIHEALDECRRTLAAADAKDPDATKRKVIDGFAALNIEPSAIAEYVGKPLDRLQPADVRSLQRLWVAITNGDTTWEQAMEAKDPTSGSKEQAEAAAKAKIELLKKQAQQNNPQQSDGGGSNSGQVATAPESGQTVSGSEPERREIPPASTPGPSDHPPANLKNLDEWPDQPVDEWYQVKGLIYRSAERDGNYVQWIPEPKRGGRLNLGGRK